MYIIESQCLMAMIDNRLKLIFQLIEIEYFSLLKEYTKNKDSKKEFRLIQIKFNSHLISFTITDTSSSNGYL